MDTAQAGQALVAEIVLLLERLDHESERLDIEAGDLYILATEKEAEARALEKRLSSGTATIEDFAQMQRLRKDAALLTSAGNQLLEARAETALGPADDQGIFHRYEARL